MSRPMIKVHNAETDEVIEREMTTSEYEQHLKDVANYETLKALETAKATEKAIAEGKLAALGLTTEDLKALGLGGN